jgi:phosphotransferase system  glucose/maltose/N-acetylglucosamine-specific IIC component
MEIQILSMFITVCCVAGLIGLYQDTNKKIVEVKDLDKDISLTARSFWTCILGGWIVGGFLTLHYGSLIKKHWEEYDSLNRKVRNGRILSILVPFGALVVMVVFAAVTQGV